MSTRKILDSFSAGGRALTSAGAPGAGLAPGDLARTYDQLSRRLAPSFPAYQSLTSNHPLPIQPPPHVLHSHPRWSVNRSAYLASPDILHRQRPGLVRIAPRIPHVAAGLQSLRPSPSPLALIPRPKTNDSLPLGRRHAFCVPTHSGPSRRRAFCVPDAPAGRALPRPQRHSEASFPGRGRSQDCSTPWDSHALATARASCHVIRVRTFPQPQKAAAFSGHCTGIARSPHRQSPASCPWRNCGARTTCPNWAPNCCGRHRCYPRHGAGSSTWYEKCPTPDGADYDAYYQGDNKRQRGPSSFGELFRHDSIPPTRLERRVAH